MEFDRLADFAEEKKIDLTVIGMDDPLVGGVVDVFESRGLRVFGPRKCAAVLEGSKAFSKDLMKKYGIDGQCFYHYYFCGKKLLEKPVENYREQSGENFPYCLIWANQSWARTWYRATKDKKILLRQSYGTKEDWEKHFYYLYSI